MDPREPDGSTPIVTAAHGALASRRCSSALTLLDVGGGHALMLDILRANSLTVLEEPSLVLFFILFTWITGAFWTAVAGFIIRLRGGDCGGDQARGCRRAGR